MKNKIRIIGLLIATFLISFSNPKMAAHTLYFVGSTFIAADVADETLWREISPLSCLTTAEVACRIVVPDDTYVVYDAGAGVNVLDVNKVNLGAQLGYTGPSPFFLQQFKPFKMSGTGTLTSITNRLHY